MTMHFAHDMPFGAQLQDGGTRFRLWAPAQQSVQLAIGSGDDERLLSMPRDDAGWFELTTDAAHAGSRYLFVLDDGTRVPDPASRFQPDDVHAASEVIDPHAYAWQCADWRGRPWRETVLYEAHVGAFSASGDYDGARAKLAHLAQLGVTALEWMPLADFEGRRNWGYDGALPFAPDSSYGRPESLKRLIDAAHARGLMVFLDVVYNHFGPSGNYLHAYAPQFFSEREHTPWGAAIDFTRREVRAFFVHNALYWLCEYRFDGLRLDAVDQIRDASHPHILEEIAARVREHCGDRHVHLVLENDDNAAHYLGGSGPCPRRMRPNLPVAAMGRSHAADPGTARAGNPPPRPGDHDRAQAHSYEIRHAPEAALRRSLRAGDQRPCETGCASAYTAQWNDDFHHAAHVLATGEHNGYYTDYVDQPVHAFARALAEGFVYQGQHSAYRDRSRGEPSAGLPPLAFVDFLQNHDQTGNRAFGERLDTLVGPEAVAALTAILLLAPSVPLLFMGEEWAAIQPWLFFCDYRGELADAVREGRRREFASFAAFADPEVRERIPDPNAEGTFAASRLDWRAAESGPGRRRIAQVRKLLGIRQREIVPYLDESMTGGRFEVADACALRVTWTLADGSQLCVAANPTASPTTGLDWKLPGSRLYASPSDLETAHVSALPAWSVAWSRG